MKIFTSVSYIIITMMLMTAGASACPVCMGAKDSPMTAGMNMAILVMLGIIGSVLMGFIGIFIFMRRRYTRLQKALSDSAYITEDGALTMKNEKGIVEWNNF